MTTSAPLSKTGFRKRGAPTDSLDVDAVLKVVLQGVDDQRKAIAEMVDVISALGDTEAAAEWTSDTMTQIGRMIREHFNPEEKILAQLGAPYAEIRAHKDDHTRLINEYVDLLMCTINGQPVSPVRLAAFLRGWLTEHVINYDLKIRDYLAPYIRAGA